MRITILEIRPVDCGDDDCKLPHCWQTRVEEMDGGKRWTGCQNGPLDITCLVVLARGYMLDELSGS